MKPLTMPAMSWLRRQESRTSLQMRVCSSGRLPELSWLQSTTTEGFSKVSLV